MIAWILLVVSAFAAPEVRIEADGTVVGTTTVAAPMSQVLPLLRDPAAIAAINGDGTTVTVTPDGQCKRLESVVPTALKTIRYVARSCDTEGGVRTVLVSSDDFTDYEVQWTAKPAATGTHLEYRYRGVVTAPVPAFIVTRATRKAIEHLMTRMTSHLATPEAPKP